MLKFTKGVTLSEVSVLLSQNSDSCETDVGQELEIKTQNAGGENFIGYSTWEKHTLKKM